MICESLEEQYKLFQKTIAMRPSDEYRIEIQGESAGSSSQYSNYQMEHIDESMQTYSTMFIGQEHFNYVGHTDVLGPVIISIKFESKETEGPRWRVILRQKEKKNSIHFIYEKDVVSKSVIKSKSSTVKQVLQMIHHSINPSKLVKVIDKAIEKRLKSLDEMQLSFKYKFGLLLCKDGQTREEEMFCNESSTPSFDRLISLLGNVIRLKGHSGFAGGLDVKNDQTGTLSLHSYWNKFEVMFHVSTFIPFIEGDPQQIQRKRHIGNDIVSIVFLDGGGQFDPRCITSQFLHIFIIIMEDPQYERDGVVPYRVSVASNRNVPSFGPNLPCPPLFWSKEALRHFILAKAINGENAAYSAPKFSKPHTRARNTLFDEIVTEYQAKSNSTPSSPLLKHKSGKDRDKEKDRDKDKEKDKEKDKICASVSKSRIATIEVQRPNYVVQSAKERGEPERSASVALHLESPRTKNLSRSTDLPEGSAASLRSESFNGLLGSSDGLRRRSRSLCSSDDFDRAPPDGIYSNNEPRNTSNDGAPSSKDDEGPGSRTPGETRKRFGFRVASRSKTASCTKAQPE
ncbi:uncharacterized protein BJ171DRAFT_52470 [Polychytrium aggregatum]|uniref:uncharacterized protein n=1 Tax=Polychytrium aggregatum TaxID=110093 RepID=UPI0022FDE8BE|nr:uncharacterized protein BJ171DRAFT_52470 [Polychytrium aggregatum]KAI9205805.1 hypothetical protein BJ171DRAFT_52470 [Polychytrium aggregatum]